MAICGRRVMMQRVQHDFVQASAQALLRATRASGAETSNDERENGLDATHRCETNILAAEVERPPAELVLAQ